MLPHRSSFSDCSLHVAPETLFHDEEIAFSGINVDNPLWDNGDSSSRDEDPLLPPTRFMEVAQHMLPPPRKIVVVPKKSKSPLRRFVEEITTALVAIAVVCVCAGLMMLSLSHETAVWASPGLLIDDDDIVDREVVSFEIIDCPVAPRGESWSASFADYRNALDSTQNVSLCEEEFADDCSCQSAIGPVIPNQPLLGDSSAAIVSNDLDVVLLGDTMIENCARGLSDDEMDHGNNAERSGMAAVCHQLFRKDRGGLVNGIALGASDYRTGHLLYRLQEEKTILNTLNPKVWWIQIGTTDFAEDHCSSEVVAAAIIPLVHEIKVKHPQARIVVNSILPSASLEGARDRDDAWKSLAQANQYLECFADHSDDFEFFDAGNIFSKHELNEGISLNVMRSWGEAIVGKVLELAHT